MNENFTWDLGLGGGREGESFTSLPLYLNVCTSKVVKSDFSHFHSKS